MTEQNLAQRAISLLKIGIEKKNKHIIQLAYDIVENKNFEWGNYSEHEFEEWNCRIDESNDILLS